MDCALSPADVAPRVEQLTLWAAGMLDTNPGKSLRERLHARHGLVVGDIVCCRCGPRHNSVNFYEVIRVSSESVAVIRQIEADVQERVAGSMVGTATPRAGRFLHDARPTPYRASGWHMLGSPKRWRGALGRWEGHPLPVDWRDEHRWREDNRRRRLANHGVAES